MSTYTVAMVSIAVLHEFSRRLKEQQEKQQQYRPSLQVPVGPRFELDALNEVYCKEFFR